jgi:molybdenum-dependent DNA-binding transcriptional regulator ModE
MIRIVHPEIRGKKGIGSRIRNTGQMCLGLVRGRQRERTHAVASLRLHRQMGPHRGRQLWTQVHAEIMKL